MSIFVLTVSDTGEYVGVFSSEKEAMEYASTMEEVTDLIEEEVSS